MAKTRKHGIKRERNGRAQRETDLEVMAPVLLRRRRELGMTPDAKYDVDGKPILTAEIVDQMKKLKGQEGGTPWGHLYLRGDITDRQQQAASAFWMMRQDYLKAIYAPKESPKCGSMDPDARGATLMAENVDWAKSARIRYASAEKVLLQSGPTAARAVNALLAEQRVVLHHLILGLDALSAHLLDGHKKAA